MTHETQKFHHLDVERSQKFIQLNLIKSLKGCFNNELKSTDTQVKGTSLWSNEKLKQYLIRAITSARFFRRIHLKFFSNYVKKKHHKFMYVTLKLFMFLSQLPKTFRILSLSHFFPENDKVFEINTMFNID